MLYHNSKIIVLINSAHIEGNDICTYQFIYTFDNTPNVNGRVPIICAYSSGIGLQVSLVCIRLNYDGTWSATNDKDGDSFIISLPGAFSVGTFVFIVPHRGINITNA